MISNEATPVLMVPFISTQDSDLIVKRLDCVENQTSLELCCSHIYGLSLMFMFFRPLVQEMRLAL